MSLVRFSGLRINAYIPYRDAKQGDIWLQQRKLGSVDERDDNLVVLTTKQARKVIDVLTPVVEELEKKRCECWIGEEKDGTPVPVSACFGEHGGVTVEEFFAAGKCSWCGRRIEVKQ